MTLLLLIIIVILLSWIYVFWFRHWALDRWPKTFARWHVIEDRLWDNSRTLLMARLYWVGGVVIAAHEIIASTDWTSWTPLLQQIAWLVPESWRPWVLIASLVLTGGLFEVLRWRTTQPVNEQKRVAKKLTPLQK